jgi:hypothetical protein
VNKIVVCLDDNLLLPVFVLLNVTDDIFCVFKNKNNAQGYP